MRRCSKRAFSRRSYSNNRQQGRQAKQAILPEHTECQRWQARLLVSTHSKLRRSRNRRSQTQPQSAKPRLSTAYRWLSVGLLHVIRRPGALRTPRERGRCHGTDPVTTCEAVVPGRCYCVRRDAATRPARRRTAVRSGAPFPFIHWTKPWFVSGMRFAEAPRRSDEPSHAWNRARSPKKARFRMRKEPEELRSRLGSKSSAISWRGMPIASARTSPRGKRLGRRLAAELGSRLPRRPRPGPQSQRFVEQRGPQR
jgi:hypothetical protein